MTDETGAGLSAKNNKKNMFHGFLEINFLLYNLVN